MVVAISRPVWLTSVCARSAAGHRPDPPLDDVGFLFLHFGQNIFKPQVPASSSPGRLCAYKHTRASTAPFNASV